MAQNETAKFQTIQSLDNLNGALSLTGTLCDLIGQAPYQLNVFSAVTRHFTVAGDVFTSTKSFLESMEGETDEINGNYAAIQRATDACHRETRYLQGLCSAVNQSENKTEGYREAARRGNGKTVEMAMMELLRAAQSIAADPLVAPDRITALQDALREVEGLPSSLEEVAPGAGFVMNNSGSGSQLYNSGKGSMNYCTGGFMITGPSSGAKFEYASREGKEK